MRVCFFGTYDRFYTSNKLMIQGLLENGVEVLEINAQTKVTTMTKSSDLSVINIVKRLLQKLRIFVEVFKNLELFAKSDVIYVGFPGHVDVFIAFFIAKIFGKKLVFNPILIISKVFTEEVSTVDRTSNLARIIKFVESLVYRLCDVVFADTPEQKRLLVREFGINSKKVKVLPLGADNIGYEFSEYKNIREKRISVVYYGLYSPIHGVEYIIEAANLLRDDPGITFSMVGNGPTFAVNYRRAKSLGLKNIAFYPDIREGAHLRYLQKADVFLGFLQRHPSVERIVGNKVYQGMALGRVVLTADSPVIRSMFVDKKNIYLCKPADSKDLAKALLVLKNNPELRGEIARNSYALYLAEFTPKVVANKFMDEVSPLVRDYSPLRAKVATSLAVFVTSIGEILERLTDIDKF